MNFVIFSFSVQEVLTIFEEMSNDGELMNHDTIIAPPINGKLMDEYNGPDDTLTIDNLTRSQLLISAIVERKYKAAVTQTAGDSSSENDDKEVLSMKIHIKKIIKRQRWKN